MMHYFHNDYNRMCHPAVIQKIQAYHQTAMPGYGTDDVCARAADRIRKLCSNESLSVHFLTGGTQTNLTVIDAGLRPHQGVICAQTGHIHVHETGAVEATGHKPLVVNSDDGKVTAQQVQSLMQAHLSDGDREHTVQPKMVYISNSTELGTVYTKKELQELSDVCKRYALYLFMDGARLGYALASTQSDVTFADLAELCDVFYIGLTKVGAMFGEAVVISNPALAQDFRYLMKQKGAMLAKGWLLGIQAEALLEDGLYLEISRHANSLADMLRDTLQQLGYQLSVPGSSNQVFPILPVKLLSRLSGEFTYSPMQYVDGEHQVVRFCTSWANTREEVEALCQALRDFS